MFSQKGMSGHCQNLSHRHDDGQATDTWCLGTNASDNSAMGILADTLTKMERISMHDDKVQDREYF